MRSQHVFLSFARKLLVPLLFWSATASAYTLSFDPVAQTVPLGSQALVDVRIADVLPAGLGAYDFDVLFDPSILAFNSSIDGMGLGAAIGLDVAPGVGSLTVSDFSLDSVADLLALQQNDFILFRLAFDTLAPGTSALDFSAVTLGDAAGTPVAPDGLLSGNVTVLTNGVPEPGSLALLFAAAIAGMLVAGRGRAGRRRH